MILNEDVKKEGIKLLLIPPINGDILYKDWFIPVGLLSIYSNLRLHNFSPTIFHPSENLDFEQGINTITDQIIESNPDLIGFSTWCSNYPFVLSLSSQIKSKADIPILLGGPQASIVAFETLNSFPSIDYILQGEADNSIIQFLNFLFRDRKEPILEISGLAYRDDNGEVKLNSIAKVGNELDDLPVPAYNQLDETAGFRIDAGRGCPYKCSYCTTNQFFSQKYRTKSPSRIIKEMDYCNEISGTHSFGLAHDMLTLNKKFIDSLCTSFIEHTSNTGQYYTWTCSARTDCLSKESVQKMAQAGCSDIFYGIESGSVKIQKAINKNLDLGQAVDLVAATYKCEIRPRVSFMTGFPDETEDDLEESLKLILRMTLLGAKPQMTMLSILPGTPIYEKYSDKLKFDGSFSGFSHVLLTDEEIELVKELPHIFSSFYYLPNKYLSRDLLNFVINLVNYIPDFSRTILCLKEYLPKDFSNIRLINFVQKGLQFYKVQKDFPKPEYFFLTNSIKNYLVYSHHLNIEIPDSIWDLFNIDCIKAYLRIKYYRNIQKKIIGLENSTMHEYSIEGIKFSVNPLSKLIRASYDVSLIYEKDRIIDTDCLKNLKKGEFDFLILNTSGKESKVFKLTKLSSRLFKIIIASKSKKLGIDKSFSKSKIKEVLFELLKIEGLIEVEA